MSTETTTQMTPMENAATAKKLFMTFAAFCAGGVLMLLVSALLANLPIDGLSGISVLLFVGGYGVIAAPCMLAFVFKFGLFVDIGPMFTTFDMPMGNYIYRTVRRDYMSQMGGNIMFTFIKGLIILLISLVLTPILTLVLYIIYNRAHKKALIYADENGIDRRRVPAVNKMLVRVVALVMVALLAATIIASAVSSAVKDAQRDADSQKYAQVLASAVEALPEEYYAEAYKRSRTGGYIGEFTLDGKKVYFGEVSSNFDLVDGLYSGSVYYIIDDVLYLDLVGGGFEAKNFTVCDTAAVKEYLLSRHLTQNVGEGATLLNGYFSDGMTHLELEYQGQRYRLFLNGDDRICKMQMEYTSEEFDNMPEIGFEMDNGKDLTEYKNIARALSE